MCVQIICRDIWKLKNLFKKVVTLFWTILSLVSFYENVFYLKKMTPWEFCHKNFSLHDLLDTVTAIMYFSYMQSYAIICILDKNGFFTETFSHGIIL